MLHFFLSLLLNVLDVSYGNQNYNFHYSLKFLVYRHPRIKDVKKNLLKQKLKVYFTGRTALNNFHRKVHTASALSWNHHYLYLATDMLTRKSQKYFYVFLCHVKNHRQCGKFKWLIFIVWKCCPVISKCFFCLLGSIPITPVICDGVWHCDIDKMEYCSS